jgi:tetratricopeptide (TPR) repeat protein
MRLKSTLSLALAALCVGAQLTPIAAAQTRRSARGNPQAAAEARRKAAEAETQHQAEEEAKRKQAEEEEAAKRKAAEEEAKAKQLAEDARRAEEERQRAEAEARRRQEIAVQFKKIQLLTEDNKSDEAQAMLDAVLKANEQDAEVSYQASAAYIGLGNYLAAEYHIKQAISLAPGPALKNTYELQLVEFNYKREKLKKELLESVSSLIEEVNYVDAAKTLQGMDKIMAYDQDGYIMRAGLTGVFRDYESALKLYNRVLEDKTLTPETRARVESLRDYCAAKVTAAAGGTMMAAHICHFCRASIPAKAAYCPVCLAFQHHVAQLKSKDRTTTFEWGNGRIESVSFLYRKTHKAGNFFRAAAGVMSAAGGTPTEVMQRDDDTATRDFKFLYNALVPSSVAFSSSAEVGGSSTEMVQKVGESGTATEASRTAATREKKMLSDTLIYASNPNVDASFAMLAFNQNVFRGFASNDYFSYLFWNEPHIFVLYYDKDQRVTKAVDSYTYGDTTVAGYRVVKDRKPFTGPNRLDPLSDPYIVHFQYNDEGLLSSIIYNVNEKQVYRRDITYGPSGIASEQEIYQDGKIARTTTYAWVGDKLVSAKTQDGIIITFQ